jgi:hypothetical protein
MILREILQQMVDDGDTAKLSNGNGSVEAATLLKTLSEPMLNRTAHLQPGLYIAELDERGYLGRVLLRFTQKT